MQSRIDIPLPLGSFGSFGSFWEIETPDFRNGEERGGPSCCEPIGRCCGEQWVVLSEMRCLVSSSVDEVLCMYFLYHHPTQLDLTYLVTQLPKQARLAVQSIKLPLYFLKHQRRVLGTRTFFSSPQKLVHVSDPNRRYSGKAIIDAKGWNVWSAA